MFLNFNGSFVVGLFDIFLLNNDLFVRICDVLVNCDDAKSERDEVSDSLVVVNLLM